MNLPFEVRHKESGKFYTVVDMYFWYQSTIGESHYRIMGFDPEWVSISQFDVVTDVIHEKLAFLLSV